MVFLKIENKAFLESVNVRSRKFKDDASSYAFNTKKTAEVNVSDKKKRLKFIVFDYCY